jgi:hypothetical protein
VPWGPTFATYASGFEQQAASGILEVEDAAAASDERRYSLSPRHVEALLDESNLNYIAPIERLMVAYPRPVDASGADVP